MAETGCHEIHTPAFVHKLLDRSEWKGRPEALKAVENEKRGLLANGLWDESKIRPKSEVFRGDSVKDEENQAAVFDEIAASAPTSLGGLNLIVAYGLQEGHETSTSDCIKAYVQSVLSSSQQPMCV